MNLESTMAIATIISSLVSIIGGLIFCVRWYLRHRKLMKKKEADLIIKNAKARPYRYEEIIYISRSK